MVLLTVAATDSTDSMRPVTRPDNASAANVLHQSLGQENCRVSNGWILHADLRSVQVERLAGESTHLGDFVAGWVKFLQRLCRRQSLVRLMQVASTWSSA
jgi:hypothetical protein